MEQTIHPELATELTTDDPVEIKKLIDQYLEAMQRKNENIARDWEEIARLKAETHNLLGKLTLGANSAIDKAASYRQILARVIEDYAKWLSQGNPIQLLPVFDVIRDQYLIVSLGRENDRREHAIVFHAQLRDGLICIEADWTEEGLSDDLIAAGVDEKDLRWSWASHKEELPLVA